MVQWSDTAKLFLQEDDACLILDTSGVLYKSEECSGTAVCTKGPKPTVDRNGDSLGMGYLCCDEREESSEIPERPERPSRRRRPQNNREKKSSESKSNSESNSKSNSGSNSASNSAESNSASADDEDFTTKAPADIL